jgi:peptidoglycan/LPS O-acetylase OafA/YrhL
MSQLKSSVPSGRLNSIDALRGTAALIVLLAHALGYHDQPVDRPAWYQIVFTILYQGYLGVPLFFLISGFCIHLPWARKRASLAEVEPLTSRQLDLDFQAFWKRRLRRLYPPYAIVLCLSMGLLVLLYWRGTAYSYVANYPEPATNWIALDFVTHVLMLHWLHPVLDGGGGNRAFWTLAREECFYLVYFPLLAWRRKLGMSNAMIIVGAVSLALPWCVQWLVPDSFQRTMPGTVVSYAFNTIHSAPLLWIQWCLGMVAAEAYAGTVQLPRWCSLLWLTPLWFAAAKWSESYANALRPLLWGMVFFTLINACVQYECKGSGVHSRPLQWLGEKLAWLGVFSYSIYLVHQPLITILTRVFQLKPDGTPHTYLLHVLFLTVLILIMARLFFLAVERKFLNVPVPATSA